MARVLRIAALLVLAVGASACPKRNYVLLSPEENYSDDPALSIQVEKVAEVEKGRTEIRLEIENKRETAVSLAEAEATLVDADDKTMRALTRPQDTIEPAGARTVVFAFDTTTAAKGALEMQLAIPGVKVWPIIFSTEKPPDFKPVPEAGPGGGPQGPGGLGPSPR